MDKAALGQLREISGMIEARDLAALADVQSRIADVVAALAALDRGADTDGLDPLQAERVRLRWREWARNERGRLMGRRAELAVEEIAALEAAGRAVGRSDVLKRIADARRR